MTTEFTIWERLILQDRLAGASQNDLTLGEVALALSVLEKISLSAEERERLGVTFNPEAKTIVWNDGAQGDISIDFSPPEWAMLRRLVSMITGWPIDVRVVALSAKLMA